MHIPQFLPMFQGSNLKNAQMSIRGHPYRQPLERPIQALALLFLGWKLLLLLIAAGSPGPGYDTSALILYSDHSTPGDRHTKYGFLSSWDRLALNLFRWDAIYFVKSAERGYVHEQEWAFSWVFARTLNGTENLTVTLRDNVHPLRSLILAGLAISHMSHFFSVLILHRLTSTTLAVSATHRVPFLAAALHIISPAGLFLSTPYSESLFSLCTFSGMLFFVRYKSISTSQMSKPYPEVFFLLASGCCFALSATIRSNGLLSGVVYVHEVVSMLPVIVTFRLSFKDLRRLIFTSIAGVLIGVGFIGPQWLAYREFCVSRSLDQLIRPWCTRTFPSIYSWVQSHYWDVGFLRYWTLSNVPLFLIAAPMLWLLIWSSVTILSDRLLLPTVEMHPPPRTNSDNGIGLVRAQRRNLINMALPQLVLGLMALTSFHVQIINRLSSGYPLWYIVVAIWLTDRDLSASWTSNIHLSHLIIYFTISYSIIQGALYANFLPPA